MRKSSLLHTDRECGIILEKTLYGKDKHDELSLIHISKKSAKKVWFL